MTNQASEVKRNSLNKPDEDVKLERINQTGGRAMTDNTQAELKKIHSLIHQPSYAVVYPETSRELGYPIEKSILDWSNKQVEQAYSDGFKKASKGAFKSQQEAKREAVESVLDRLDRSLNWQHTTPRDVIAEIEAERNKLKEQ